MATPRELTVSPLAGTGGAESASDIHRGHAEMDGAGELPDDITAGRNRPEAAPRRHGGGEIEAVAARA